MYEPHQLEFLLSCLRETKRVPGSCVEVGCAYGATTVFLKKYLNHLGDCGKYIAIDTFSGFKKEDAQYEVEIRHKDPKLVSAFTSNRREWVSQTLKLSEIADVELVQCDATKYDFESARPISFCLIDIDLYKPIKTILPMVYSAMAEGGIIVVDDCQAHPLWDGALVAYEEFIEQHDLPRDIAGEKLGIIRI
jgi:predicted O-methyltransferase YrrM